jgi:uncharacterized coiled-coil protein SlyX
MTTDISKIRLSLKKCEEITLPYKFTPTCWVKYITLKGDDEAFYEGGEFLRMGDHKIFLINKGKQVCAPTCVRSDDGSIIYKSRFFIDPTKNNSTQNKSELDKVVSQQQNVIKTMAKQIKLLEDQLLQHNSSHYDMVTQLEENDKELNKLLINEKKYKLMLSKYIH